MNGEQKQTEINPDLPEKRLARYTEMLVVVWTILLFGFFALDVIHLREDTERLAIKEARAHFNKDQAFRYWAASHGGVYVPATEKTPPNPYLSEVPERDIRTPSGKLLTLMNPAYMVRQMNQFFKEMYGVTGHITSLNLHRPENVADAWERDALLAFQRGEKEVLEFTEINGKPYIRLMQPMITVEGCLKCHAYQGYKLGDVRGGVSVSVPLEPLYVHERKEAINDALTHSTIWIVGLIGIITGYKRLKLHLRERELANEALTRWGEIFRHAEWGVAIGSADGKRLEMVNDTFAAMHGRTVEALTGSALIEAFHPEKRGKLAEEIEKARELGHYTFESVHIGNDGTSFPVLIDVTAIKDESGKVLYLVMNVQDITGLKETEKKLKEQLDELRRWNSLNLDREERIIELKEEVNQLLEDSGKEPRYAKK